MTKKVYRNNLSETVLTQLNEYIYGNMGLYFPENRWIDLSNKFHLASLEFGFTDDISCLDWLLSEPADKHITETLASCLTIGETFFYRDKHIFTALEREVFPGLIRSRQRSGKRIRIWSAGCATGEEPLSIAMLLHKMIPDIRNWDISILATDINPQFLSKASDGIYKKWSLRGTPDWVIKRYFTKTPDGLFKIVPDIKRMVTFSYHNLTEDIYPSLINSTNALDIVFCRNVLMYFHQEKARMVIKRFHRSILNGGWLIVGGSEGGLLQLSGFVMKSLSDTILYRKEALPLLAGRTSLKSNARKPRISGPLRMKNIERKVTVRAEPERDKKEKSKPASFEEALEMYQNGDYEELEKKLNDLLTKDKQNSKAMMLFAKALSNQGKFNEAREWCMNQLVIDRMEPGSHYLLALIHREQGQIEDAITSLKQSIYLEQDFIMAHFSLGNLMLRQENSNMANRHFKNALSILDNFNDDEILPESDGLSAGRLTEIICSIMEKKHVE
ncbi:MAG: tetratricopeptide repeat protein [Bacteroidales bacterium]|nr:tetratricopeptide repeat protein [Bacteroidales bacterium]